MARAIAAAKVSSRVSAHFGFPGQEHSRKRLEGLRIELGRVPTLRHWGEAHSSAVCNDVKLYSEAINFPHFLNIILQVDQFVADNSVEWTLTSAAPAPTSNISAADQRPAKLQKQDIEKELARVLRWYYCPDDYSDQLAWHPWYMMFDISYSRESDAIKKNEPVIDWLDANIGRVSIKIPLLTCYSQQVSL